MNDAKIADAIAARRVRAAEMRRTLELYEAETKGMEAALSYLAKAGSASGNLTRSGDLASQALMVPHHGVTRKTAGGRQPGAISKEWRGILAYLYATYPDGFSEPQIIREAARFDREIKPRDARNQMDLYLSHGYVELTDNAGWKVTDAAAQRFGFVSLEGVSESELKRGGVIPPHATLVNPKGSENV